MRDFAPIAALYKKHFWPLALGILFALLTALASISLLSLSGWFLSASALAGLLALNSFNYLLPAAGVRFFSISRTAGRWIERVVGHDATFKLLASLRVFFFDKLVPLTPNTAINLRDADILNRITADVDAMDHLYLRLVNPLIVAFFGIMLTSSFIAWLDFTLGIVLGSLLLGLLLVLPVLFYYLGKPHGIALAKTKSALRITLLDWLQGFAELEIHSASSRFKARILANQQQFLQAQQQMATVTALANALLVLASGLVVITLLYFAADGVAGKAQDPIIALVVFATMASIELLLPIAAAFQFLSNTAHSANRLNQILQATPNVQFSHSSQAVVTQGELVFNKLSFCYPNNTHHTLVGINLRISAGEKVALLGSTGSGKSTLLQLITRAWDASEGQIMLDGVPLTDYSETELRQAISVVTQRVDLFNASLRHNLVIAKENATDNHLITVLKQVGLSELTKGQGLDMWLGDGGRQLSGGERRRIGIARAILHDAPILLLDEPTEGLDAQTEQQILALLMHHSKNKTVLYITHRQAGLNAMDSTYRLEHGQLV